MEKDSALYQFMDTRMNSVMSSIVNSDGEYQEILRRSDVYSGRLEQMDLPEGIRLLIDRYVSEQTAHSTDLWWFSAFRFFSFCFFSR